MLALQDYGSSDEEKEKDKAEVSTEPIKPNLHLHLQPIKGPKPSTSLIAINAAPEVISTKDVDPYNYVDPLTKELTRNPKYDELFAPVVGPEFPFRTQQQKAHRNMLSGYTEDAHFNEFQFETQRRTFTSYGYAVDPSVEFTEEKPNKLIGSVVEAEDKKGISVFEASKKRKNKRSKDKNEDPSDIEGYKGPWAPFKDEQRVAKPSEEEQEEINEYLAKKKRRGKQVEEKPMDDKTTLHIKDAYDYQGRSFLHIPQDVGVNLKSTEPPEKCFIPKSHIHTWQGHAKGVSSIRWFPQSAHLLLSSGMDCKVKLWEVYNERRAVRTYFGHRQAVKDINFNNSGTQFLSAGYDRYIKLWDTETGGSVSSFSSRKIAYCVKFNPDDDKQHLIVAGTSDKKIICWDIRSGEIVQEYDRHLGAVNSITFVDENRRFVTTSDDKSMRVWEWDIPVDMKYIADPTMHSMPSVKLSPNQKWLACQSMDNKIVIFSALHRFKLNRKKVFTGHMVAGYSCSLDFSPDMSYLISGDADGKAYVWDWKTTKVYSKWKAHDNVCIAALWHPHETSKVVTAGWDGLIKYWD